MIVVISVGAGGVVTDFLDTDAQTRSRAGFVEPWTDEDRAIAEQYLAARAAQVQADDARATLAAGIAAFQAAADLAQSDIATAQAAQTAAQGVQTAATTLKGQADALAAARTGDVQLLAQGISALAAQMSSLAQQVAGIQAWRQAVDANAVATDQAVIYLGRIAGRYI